jgi:hypothetical protein
VILASAATIVAVTAAATPLPSPTNGVTGPQATATLIAAIIGGTAAVAAAVLGVVNASRNLRQLRRDQWWQQFQWAIEKALSHDTDKSDVGVAVMNKLVQRKEAQKEDNEIALVVADLVTDRPNRERWWRRKS